MSSSNSPPPYSPHFASEKLPDYNTAVSSSKDAKAQKGTSQTPQVHDKPRKKSRQNSASEALLKWAEPHDGDDRQTAMLREFAKSKLYTDDNSKFCKGGLNW
jgi:hypothetical protein